MSDEETADDVAKVPAPAKSGSEFSAILSLSKNVIGAGLVALPWVFKCNSASIGVAILLTMALLSAYAFMLIARASKMSGQKTYRDIAIYCFGPKFGLICDIVMMGYTFGSCVSFIVVMGDLIPKPLDYFSAPWWLSDRTIILSIVSACTLMPMAFITEIVSLRYTSLLGLVALFVSVAFVIYHTFSASETQAKAADIVYVSPDIFSAIPVLTVSYAAHYNAPKLFQELDCDLVKFRRVLTWEHIIVFTTYVFVGGCGFFEYGRSTMSNIFKNYEDTNWVEIARLCLAVSVLFTFPLASLYLRANICNAFFKIVPGSVPREKLWIYVTVTVALVVFSTFVGIIFPEIDKVLTYKGSLFGTFVIYVFPAIFYLHLVKQAQPASFSDPLNAQLRESAVYDPVNASPSPSTSLDSDEPLGPDSPLLGRGRKSCGSVVCSSLSRGNLPLGVWLGPVVLLCLGVVTGVLGTVVTVLKQAGVINS